MLATVRWGWKNGRLRERVIHHVPFMGHSVEEVEFHRLPTREEVLCIMPCLSPKGRWKLPGRTTWQTGDMMGAAHG